jgi:hypothetical protein
VVTRKPGPPKRDRSGFYVTPRGRFPSVTTIISQGMPKPALVHWAAWEAASCAVDNIPELVKARGQQARDELRGWIQRASERKRDTAADLGSIASSKPDSSANPHPNSPTSRCRSWRRSTGSSTPGSRNSRPPN